jgi:phosphomannomutase/phosphoglucomutase
MKPQMNPKVFREYDIRGVADRDLTDDFVTDLGRALGTTLRRAGKDNLTLGRDCRLHSPRLHGALLAGLIQTGIDVLDIGVVPTPLLYFSVFHHGAGGGVQITGSHNPPEDNGFKIMRGTKTLHGAALQDLRAQIERRDFDLGGPGRVTDHPVTAEYLAFARSRVEAGPRRFRVVVDAGNGTGGVVAVPLYESLGFEVVPLYCEMDGRFPHHHPDPTVPENMAALIDKVRETGAELGIALDGDADRIGVVDRRGRIVWGDQLMILLARAILREQPGATFVSEVKCSKALYDEIERAGGKALMWRVGHSLIKEKMKEVGALLAGEMSGHLFFAHRYLGYDDAIYAGARLIELLSRSDVTLEQHVDSLPVLHNTPEIRRDVPDESKFEIVRRAVARFRKMPGVDVVDVDGARVRWPDAWALVRASNTQAALVLRFEAETKERLAQVQAQVLAELESIEQRVRDGGRHVEFFYDLGSPYSYLAATQLPGLSQRTGAEVVWRPMLLGAVFAATGNTMPAANPQKGRYLMADLERWARHLQVPYRFPSRFPMNTLKAMRLCVQAEKLLRQEALAQRLFRAYWAEDADISDDATLRRLLLEVGLPADELLAGCGRPEVKDALRHQTEEAVRRGVFGAPAFFVGDDLYWGNDRLMFVEEALQVRGG